MNDGQITKTFIASGNNSEKALINLKDSWDHGFVEAIYVPHQPSDNFRSIELDEPKLSKDFNFMVIDNEASAIKRAIEYISHVHHTSIGVEILGIILVDSINSTFSEELVGLHEKITEITSASFVQVNQCEPMMIQSLIAMYAHLYCGFSITCLELQDLFSTLNSGYYFQASKVTATTVFELPYAVHQAADNIRLAANGFSKAQGLALVIISNEELVDLSVLTACVDILKGIVQKEINLVFHTNIQALNSPSILLGASFSELTIKKQPVNKRENDNTLDIPSFMR